MGWLIPVGLLILLGCMPLGVSVLYQAGGPVVELLTGPIRIPLYPRKKNVKTEKAEADKPVETTTPSEVAQTTDSQEQKGGLFSDFLPLLKVVGEFLMGFRRKLRIKRLEMNLCMAGGDPCDLAINYGRAWAAVGNIMPQLERLFVIQKRDVQVQCDFTQSQTTLYFRADITITLGRLLGLLLRYGWRGLRQYIKITNKRKGGAVK